MKNIKKNILGVVANMSMTCANMGANSACSFITYQPKMPEKLKYTSSSKK